MNLWVWLLCVPFSQCLLHLNNRAHSLNTKASCFINGVQFISCFHADNLPRERKEFRWQDLRSVFLTPLNSSQVGISPAAAPPACITHPSRDGWLHGCWRAPRKASVFSGRVLTKVRAFRDFDSIESQQLFSLLPFLQDWPQNTSNYHPGKNLLVEQNLC